MTEFTRTQTLVSRIQSILREYPCGDTIIYELVQNADDAAAQVSTIVVDPGFGTAPTAVGREESVGWNPCMTDPRNPSLYFYNSGVFTDRDLANIKRIGGDDAASKRHDATKVGRFGVGFNSTFHLSDVVAFVTQEKLIVMDPACEHLPLRDGRPVEGLMWDFTNTAALGALSATERSFVAELLARFEECGLGFSRTKPFQGTVFRLALRQRPSKFWRVVHPVASVMKLLTDFFYSARVSMVLLKNVATINALMIDRSGSSPVPQHLFSLGASWTDTANTVRKSIVKWLASYTTVMQSLIAATDDLDGPAVPGPEHYQAKLPAPLHRSLSVQISYKTSKDFAQEPNAAGVLDMDVSHQLGPATWDNSQVWALSDAAARHHDPIFVPWAAAITESGKRVNGRMLCFFPIQGHSQLPMHVHAYFQLSSDRQSIISVERSKWNRALATEVVPGAFTRAVLRFCESRKPSYSLWPSGQYTDSTVKLIAEHTIDRLADSPSILTAGGYKRFAETLVFPETDVAVHERILLHASNMATCVDLATELSLLNDAVKAVAARNPAKARVAKAPDYRATFANAASLPPMNADLASIIFYRCTEDDKLSELATLGINKAMPIIPLQSGGVGHWFVPTPNIHAKGTPPPQSLPLLLALNEDHHELCRQLPHLQNRLIKWFAADENTTSAPSAEDATLLQMKVANQRRLRSFAKLVCAGIHELTPERLVTVLKSCLAAPAYVFKAANAWELSPSPTMYPMCRIPVPLVCKAVFTLPAAFELPLLPDGTMLLDDAGFAPIAAGLVVPATSLTATSASTVAVPYTPSPAVVTVVKCLLGLGNRVLFPGILPEKLMSEWAVGDVKILNVAMSDRGTVEAISNAFRRFGEAKIDAELGKAFAHPSAAAHWMEYLCSAQPRLISADVELVARLPIFTDYWGRRVDLKGLERQHGISAVSVQPNGLAPWLVDALQRDLPEYSALRQFTLLPAPSPTAQSLWQTLKIKPITSPELTCAVATSLPLPSASVPFNQAPNLAWACVLAEIAALDGARAPGESLIMSAAIDALRKHRFLPSMMSEVHLRPSDCITSGALTKYDALIALLVQLQGRYDKKVAGTDPKNAAAVAALPHPPFVPFLDCFCAPTRVGGAPDPLAGPMKRLRVQNRLEGRPLLETIRAFAEFAAEDAGLGKNEQLRCYAGALIMALEDDEALTSDEWKALESIPFVPVVDPATKVISLAPPKDAIFPPEFDLNPIGAKQCILLEDIRSAVAPQHRKGLFNTAANFKWAEKPSSRAMVDFLNWTGTCADKEKVRCLGRGIWAVYETFDRLVQIQTDNKVSAEDTRLAMADLKTLKYLYLPGRGVAVKRELLAQHPAAQRLEPHLAAVDRTLLERYPAFFAVLQIPEVHSPDLLIATIASLSGRGKVGLNDQSRDQLAATLEYAVQVIPPNVLKERARDIYIPTTDGKAAPANTVVYDFFSTGEQAASNTLMHASVNSNVARGLGMTHSGTSYLKNMQATMARPVGNRSAAFQAKGPRLSLTNAIQRILGDYSDTQAVLLEMLQNADDARAQKLCFFLDNRTFKTEKEGLLGEGMQRCQGPALVVTNDAVFKDSDFEALMDIGCGHKSQDNTTIGRFGVGFNTVYHVTDCPSLISASQTLFLDPAMKHLDGVAADNPGLAVQHVLDPNIVKHFPHQFAPYELYGVDLKKPFQGTLFRLPLRQAAQPWSLSQTAWSPQDVRGMLMDFVGSVLKTSMLFLKSIVCIEVNEVDERGHVHSLARSSFNNMAEVREHRSSVMKFLHDYPLNGPIAKDAFVLTTPHAISLTAGKKTRDVLINVTTLIKSPHSIPDAITTAVPPKLQPKLVQWTSVAVEVHNVSRIPIDGATGRLACFLPLPCPTGLPSYIHGCFALSSDRRNLATEAFGSKQSWEVQWNSHLMTLVAQCLSHSVLFTAHSVITSPKDLQGYYGQFPLAEKVDGTLKKIVEPFYEYLVARDAQCLWSERHRWIGLPQACFAKTGSQAPKVVMSGPVLDSLMSEEDLVILDEKLVEAFAVASRAMSTPPPVFMTPSFVVKSLQRCTAGFPNAAALPFSVVFPSLAQARVADKVAGVAEVVGYLTTSDEAVAFAGCPMMFLDAAAAPARGGDDSSLLGLIGSNVYVAMDGAPHNSYIKKLFPSFDGILNATFWHLVRSQPQSNFTADTWANLGVLNLSIKTLARFLDRHGPHQLKMSKGRPAPWSGRSDDPLAKWLSHMWQFLAADVTSIPDVIEQCGDLKSWPIVPAKRGAARVLIPLGEASMLLSGDADQGVQDLLALIGIDSLDREFNQSSTVRQICKIAEVDGTKVADVLKQAQSQGRFAHMTGDQREALLEYLVRTGESNKGFFSRVASRLGTNTALPMADTIRQLPLFECVDLDGTWVYRSLDQGAKALPDGVPLTPVCRGYYRKEYAQFQLNRDTILGFFQDKFLPLYDGTLPDSIALARRNDPNGPAADSADYQVQCPMSRVLSLEAELEHWRLMFTAPGVMMTLQHRITGIPIVPVSTPLPPLNRTERGSLKNIVSHYIVSKGVPFVKDLEEAQQFEMVRRLQMMELRAIDTDRRATPAQCVGPMTVTGAPFPNCVSLVMRIVKDSQFFVVPDALWSDVAVRGFLEKVGVSSSSASRCIATAANALADTMHGHTELLVFTRTINDMGIVLPPKGAGTQTSAIYDVFHRLGVSLTLAIIKFGDEEGRKQLSDIAYLLPTPRFDVCGAKMAQTIDDAQPPKNMIRHKHAALAFTSHRVAHPLLDECTMIPEPSTQSIIAHLFSYNLSGTKDPQPRLGTADAIDRSLEAIYSFLAQQRGHALKDESRILQDPLFAVPRPIARRCRGWNSEEDLLDPSSGAAIISEISALPPHHRKLVPFSCLMSAPRVESVAPYLFQLSDFDGLPGLQAMIRALPPLQTPKPIDVIRRIPGAASALASYPASARATCDAISTYINMLSLLVSSAEYHKVNLADEAAKYDVAARKAGTLKAPTHADPSSDVANLISRLPLLLSDGDFASLCYCTIPDSPAMIKRLNLDKVKLVHSQITIPTCKALGVPSMVYVMREEPISASVLPRIPAIHDWNTMLQSSDFIHGLMRILETEAMNGGRGGSGGTSMISSAVATSGSRVLRRPGIMAAIRQVKCERVAKITAKMTDIRDPTVNIAAESNTTATSMSAYNSKQHSIYLVIRDLNTAQGQNDLVTAPFRLAMEINRLISGLLQNLAPLAALCSQVGQIGSRGIEDFPRILDDFDCVTVDSSTDGFAVRNNVVSVADVRKYGKCILPFIRICGLPGGLTPVVHAKYLDPNAAHMPTMVAKADALGVLRWATITNDVPTIAHCEGDKAVARRTSAVVVMPLHLSGPPP